MPTLRDVMSLSISLAMVVISKFQDLTSVRWIRKGETSKKSGPSFPITGKEKDVAGNPIKLISSSEVPDSDSTQTLKGKRAALDEKKSDAPKKRAVLQDISNVTTNRSFKVQKHNIKVTKKGRESSSKVASSSDEKLEVLSNSGGGGSLSGCTRTNEEPLRLGKVKSCVGASSTNIIDIDSDDKDPLLCSLYAPQIFYYLRVAEQHKGRPFSDCMDTIQLEVTQTMRRTLISWLVEVSEDYAFVADTLHLTVYLIDWFLDGNIVEIHRLQLLGITCMLIASKSEEISVPRIEEFCFITDNTYTSDEVREMEIEVLKHFNFQVYFPTSKKFLRRYLRAAQLSSGNPRMELEYLANYLTELTLTEYSFLKFFPSVIAASAVFLAKWTLNQSHHPWNPTLEHYTMYKASDLKEPVHALQALQLNTKDCHLNSTRMKYRQGKFKSVAVFLSAELPEKLFIS